jgi:hypothetical protein
VIYLKKYGLIACGVPLILLLFFCFFNIIVTSLFWTVHIRVVVIMGGLDITSASQTPVVEERDGVAGEVLKVQNEDELRLAQMGGCPLLFKLRVRIGVNDGAGHKQELKRHFSVWSLIGLAANCTISWTGSFSHIFRRKHCISNPQQVLV